MLVGLPILNPTHVEPCGGVRFSVLRLERTGGGDRYQVTLGGSDGSLLSGAPAPGKVVGPSFSAAEVPEVIEAVLDAYRDQRRSDGARAETFIDTLRRVGLDPFKAAANGARFTEKQEA